MKHSFLDKWSQVDSYLKKRDPRLKIILTFSFLILLILTPPTSYLTFSFFFLFVTFFIILSKIPVTFYLKRIFILIPFLLVILAFAPFLGTANIGGSYNLGSIEISRKAILIFWNCFIKSTLSILSLTLLISTTGFTDLLKAFQDLKIPSIFIQILSFMYRYIFLIGDEAMKLWQAKEARTIKRKKKLEFKAVSSIIGILFLRSYERAEDIYQAMLARGFKGEIKTINTFSFRVGDLIFLFLASFYLISIKLIFG